MGKRQCRLCGKTLHFFNTAIVGDKTLCAECMSKEAKKILFAKNTEKKEEEFRNITREVIKDKLNIALYVSENTPIENEVNNLLKEAIKKKQEKDLNNAIDCLKNAYSKIDQINIEYGVETFLRLPLYLHSAGRKTEAWQEFNKLLENGYPKENKSPGSVLMHKSNIFDKMRLVLQRDKEYDEAIIFGVLSLLSNAVGWYKKEFLNEFKNSIVNIEDNVKNLFKKVDNQQLQAEVIQVTRNVIKSIPDFNDKEVEIKLTELIDGYRIQR